MDNTEKYLRQSFSTEEIKSILNAIDHNIGNFISNVFSSF